MGKKVKSPAKKANPRKLPGSKEADQALLVAAEKGDVSAVEAAICSS